MRLAGTVHYERKRIVVDGRARLLLSGEVHYFRLRREEWQDRLDKAKRAGLNTIATYIPWLWHELPDATVDVDGRTRPERDLGAFLDLCHANDFYVIARPGPFVMAELKNEGLPFRLYTEHPEVVPSGWDGAPAPTRTVDYLAPAFLAEARSWYRQVLPVIAARLRGNGGPVIAVQLDNEVGMLAWLHNSPDLTDGLLADFNSWLGEHGLAGRYAGPVTRSVKDEHAAALMRDLGTFMRHRFARYLTELRAYAEESGITGVPFVVNVHGTEGGRAETFPIGISQLMESYAGAPGMMSGTDLYLGELTVTNAADLYLVNAFCEAVHDADQPLASMEFEAGTGDYGCDLSRQHDPSAVDLKTRMCLAQGNKLLNYYLFTGGVNPPLDVPAGDGNDRIAFTGERHGFAAPVDPEGRLNPVYEPTTRVLRAARALAPRLAAMREEHDEVAVGFVPDLYLTEYHYPGSESVQRVLDDVVGTRGAGPRGILARAMLLGGFRFGAVNLQAGVPSVPVLALAGTTHLPAAVQATVVEYLRGGGRLLLAGRVPALDMTGEPCTVLRDALGLSPLGTVRASARFFPSVTAHGWAAPRPETRTGFAELYEPAAGDVVLRELSTGHGCGFDIQVGAGNAVVLSTDYECDLGLWRAAFAGLGATPALSHTAPVPGVVLLTSTDDAGGRIMHALNTSGYEQGLTISEHGRPLLGGQTLRLPGRRALMLPLDLSLGGLDVVHATAEAVGVEDGAVTFRALTPDAIVALRGDLTCGDPMTEVRRRDGLTVVAARSPGEFTVTRARPGSRSR
ncbi:beta-galactosidase [Actinophytocola sp.]|uniref:beta-galactosidase n=1 Tax=Actinophytocola sp. TaxID=1872138 RepID=UPI003D6AC1EB